MVTLFEALEERVPDPYRAETVPSQIVVRGKQLEAFTRILPYFEVLDRWEGHKPSYTLTANRLFEGDEATWEMFVRLFFPFLAPKIKVRQNNNSVRRLNLFEPTESGNSALNESIYTMEEVESLLEYFLVPPEKMKEVLRELKEVHGYHAFLTRPVLSIRSPYLRSGYNPNLSLTPNGNENNVTNNENYEANDEEEENNLAEKLRNVNYRRFVGSTKSRKGKTKKKRGTK
jgi:hypothetical protein